MNSESQSESDSDLEEELGLAPQLHLSTQEKIKILLLLATKKKFKLSYAAAETIMELSNVMANGDEDSDSGFCPTKHIMKRAIDLCSFALSEQHVCPGCGF